MSLKQIKKELRERRRVLESPTRSEVIEMGGLQNRTISWEMDIKETSPGKLVLVQSVPKVVVLNMVDEKREEALRVLLDKAGEEEEKISKSWEATRNEEGITLGDFLCNIGTVEC